MAQSTENAINYFQSITNWENPEDIVSFLKLYEWNLQFALEAFFALPDEYIDGESNRAQLQRILSVERQPLTTEQRNHNQQEKHNAKSDLFERSNNKIGPQTTTTIDNPHTTNQASFIEDVDQLLVQNTTTSSSMFIDIDRIQNNKKKLIEYINSSIIGSNLVIKTPWGSRTITYADYTASGRALEFIEQYILRNVLPYYSNTHSENNAVASQITRFREGSRSLIKKCVNATDEDVLIFVGSGSTAAINKLVDVLNLKDEKVRNGSVVFISTFEHHSNILPWKETNVEFVRIPNNKEGLIDQKFLKDQLEHYHNRKQIICSFNAASNVTGIQTDVDQVSELVHKYNGWVFWDYAAAAPYVLIDMNSSKTSYKDAVFISAHKFIGGPGTPGILIAKKNLFTNPIPTQPGGGSVGFVSPNKVEYLKDIESREESGTPNILGSIRAGLVFHLKDSVGCDFIEQREKELVDKFFRRFKNHKKLIVLGSQTAQRLAIFSFLVYVESFDKYLHHNFVCILLNDLFGIQVRSGCACAGPYVMDLFGIDDKTVAMYLKFVTEDENTKDSSIPRNPLMKPGFTRFNLSYFASDEEVDYILNALEFIADHGWKFLSLYKCDVASASWRCRYTLCPDEAPVFHSLQGITYENGAMEEKLVIEQDNYQNNDLEFIMTTSNDPLEQARSIVEIIPEYICDNVDFRIDPPLNVPEEHKHYVWFATSREAIRKLINEVEEIRQYNRIPMPLSLKNK